jgi:hypothetical protein
MAAAAMAERWYARLSRVLDHTLGERTPIVLDASPPHFRQTTVLPGLLPDGVGGFTDHLKGRVVLPFAPALGETLTLRSDDLSGDINNQLNENFASDDTQFGGNIGFGIMGFASNVGVRADVRYFRAFGDNALENALNLNPTTFDDNSPINILPGLDFWRANIGLAFRW